MSLLPTLPPALAIITATLVCALPWGSAGELKLVQPLLPYAVIHLAAERRGAAVPDWLVFLAGFATDVVGQGPLGFWALIYLSGYTMVRSATATQSPGAFKSIALCALTLACLGLMQWSAASIYYLRPVEIAPIAVACGAVLFVFAVLVMLLPRRDSPPARINDRLQRGV